MPSQFVRQHNMPELSRPGGSGFNSEVNQGGPSRGSSSFNVIEEHVEVNPPARRSGGSFNVIDERRKPTSLEDVKPPGGQEPAGDPAPATSPDALSFDNNKSSPLAAASQAVSADTVDQIVKPGQPTLGSTAPPLPDEEPQSLQEQAQRAVAAPTNKSAQHRNIAKRNPELNESLLGYEDLKESPKSGWFAKLDERRKDMLQQRADERRTAMARQAAEEERWRFEDNGEDSYWHIDEECPPVALSPQPFILLTALTCTVSMLLDRNHTRYPVAIWRTLSVIHG